MDFCGRYFRTTENKPKWLKKTRNLVLNGDSQNYDLNGNFRDFIQKNEKSKTVKNFLRIFTV
jgi:hypothetical protein